MKCKKPFRRGLGEYGCGQCLPCRINRNRLWTIRCLLEAGEHEHSTFATLTFREEYVPRTARDAVRPYQLFLKRYREAFGPVRYFICGEYGERTRRFHYHAILFGVRDGVGVAESWGQGHVHCSGVGAESIAYVTGYVLKGAFSESGMRWNKLEGFPEFARMSRSPGLGVKAAERIAQFFTSQQGAAVVARDGCVPGVVRQGQQKWSLGRFLKGRVQELSGLDSDALSRVRQLNEALELRQLDQLQLNDLIDIRAGKSERSGLRAEARAKRKSLERKL